MKLSQLKLNPENPQTFKKKDLKKLKNSISEFPKMMELRPLVYDPETMFVLGGNKRLICLQDLKMDEIPDAWVRSAADLTDDEKKRFIIADNVGFGEWDIDMLQDNYDIELLEEWGLELDWKDNEEEAEEDDYEIPDEIETNIKPGDIIEIGRHRLMCGSSTEIDNWKKLLKEQLADVVITDPPYNVNYTGKTKDSLTIKNDKKTDSDFYQFLYNSFNACNQVVKRGGGWYIWHADSEGANFRKAMVESGILLKQTLIWVKNSMVMGRQDYQWQHEPCLYGWKEGSAHKWYSDRKQTTILHFDRPNRNAEHPTMKPIKLISYLMKNSSKKDDLVIDGFLGSGSTMVAAHQLGRKCYGMELDPKYCQVIVDRMKKLDEPLEIKINGEIINA